MSSKSKSEMVQHGASICARFFQADPRQEHFLALVHQWPSRHLKELRKTAEPSYPAKGKAMEVY
jgi:hypothetical protein